MPEPRVTFPDQDTVDPDAETLIVDFEDAIIEVVDDVADDAWSAVADGSSAHGIASTDITLVRDDDAPAELRAIDGGPIPLVRRKSTPWFSTLPAETRAALKSSRERQPQWPLVPRPLGAVCFPVQSLSSRESRKLD